MDPNYTIAGQGLNPSQLYHVALKEAAIAQNRALASKKRADRIWSQCFLMSKGPIEERKALASTNDAYIAAEDAALQAATAANVAKAEADGLYAEFEWARSTESTRRAEMQLR